MSHSKRYDTLLLVFSFAVMGTLAADYKTVYLEDSCSSNETNNIFMEGSGKNSAGIMKASRNSTFLPNRNCTIFILPPLGLGITLSVRYLNMNPYEEPQCKNYILVTDIEGPTKEDAYLCGHSNDSTEFLSYYNTGPLKLLFHTEDFSNARSEFTFTITAFEYPYSGCPSELFRCHNNHCIWKGWTCDGHNNCGDQTDENSYTCNYSPLQVGAIIGICVGSILAFLLFAVLPVVYCCRRKTTQQGFVHGERRRILQDSSSDDRIPESVHHANKGLTAFHHVANKSTGLANDNCSNEVQTYQGPPPGYKP